MSMNDTEIIQRERGWREGRALAGRDYWTRPPFGIHQLNLPDPLADTPEGWYEFGQFLKWAHEMGWRFEIDSYGNGEYVAAVVERAAGFGWIGFVEGPMRPDFRTAIIAALAAAVRPESEATG